MTRIFGRISWGCGAVLGVMAAPAWAQAADADAISYTVRKGDTLYQLARDYLTGSNPLAELRAANRVRIPERMPVGLKLTIPKRLLRFRPIELRLVSFNGPVNVIADGRAAPAQKGAVVVEGGGVQTGSNGFALFAGNEGSRIALPSNSTVRFTRARHYLLTDAPEVEVAVDKGRAEVQAAKQKPAGSFRLRTPVAVSAVRGTVFRAGFDEARKAGTTEVTEGEVAVAAARAELAVPAGFGAAADASGDLAKEELLRPPALIDPGKVQTESAVHFDLAPVAEASGYRLQVSRDGGFTEIVSELTPATASADFAGIGNGTWFVRAAAISRRGLLGLEETWSFRRQRLGLAADAGQAGIPDGFRINWAAEGEGRQVYRFQLFAKDRPGLPMIDEGGLTEPGITLVKLPKGAYRWRVGVISVTPEGTAEVWTPFNAFNVSN